MCPGGDSSLAACFSENSCEHEIALRSSLERATKRLEGLHDLFDAQQTDVTVLPVPRLLTHKDCMCRRRDGVEFACELLPVVGEIANEKIQHIQIFRSHLDMRLGLREEVDMGVATQVAQLAHIDPAPETERQDLGFLLAQVNLSFKRQCFKTTP